jgi:hypothetical protein
MSDERPSELTFVYEEANDKRTITATGAQGGPTPDGAAVIANLYVERGSIPHHVSHRIDEHGQVNLDEPSGAVSRGEITRDIQATLQMTPEHAAQLGQWLVDKAQQAMQQREQNFGGE